MVRVIRGVQLSGRVLGFRFLSLVQVSLEALCYFPEQDTSFSLLSTGTTP